MSRPTHLTKQTTISLITAAVLLIAGFGSWAEIANSPSHKAQTAVNAQQQITYISYHGQNGQTALALLEQHAQVQTKHYSFGDFVTSIDGSVGNGPKYWTFYINGKEASMGAGAYTTKSSDTISWKLQ